MKNSLGLVIVVALTCSLVSAFAVHTLASKPEDESVDRSALERRLDDVMTRLDEFENSSPAKDSRRHISEANSDLVAAPLTAGMKSEDVEAMIRRILAESKVEPIAAADDKKEATADLQSQLARLSDPNLSPFERQGLMDALSRAGHADAVIALMKERAKDGADVAEAQTDLGIALLAKLRNGNLSHMEQGMLGMAADQAFDQALEANSEHWNARFQKAISLSFWPAAMGKQPIAISNFETLLEQQGRQPRAEHHAQTHIWLGNLYQQSGQSERAQEVWNAGLELFPDNGELQSRLGN